MAKMFYTAAEAAARLGKTEDQIKDLVRNGQLREFRDGGTINYKADDIESLATKSGTSIGRSASASGEIVLEPVEDSGIALAPSGSDVLSLADVDSEGTQAGAKSGQKAKEGTVVSSVGVSVFDDDELDQSVDPMAQTQVSSLSGLGIEGPGSGSGILDLSRERDDTSLGAELLDEIYTPEGEGGAAEMGEATRAGLDAAVLDTRTEEEEMAVPAGIPAAEPSRLRVERAYYAAEATALESGLTALLAVAVLVMLVGGLGAAAMVRGVLPGLVETLATNGLYFTLGSVGVAAIAMFVTYFVARR